MIETSVVGDGTFYISNLPLPGVGGDQGYPPACMIYTRCISFCFSRRVCRVSPLSRALSKLPKGAFEVGAALNGHSHGHGTRIRRIRAASEASGRVE